MKNDPDPGSPSSHPVTGLRALVVEDNAGDRWFYSELLRSRGYVVRSCENGEEAWKVWLAEAPPLALVDLMLPGIDGFELCRRIRAHPRGGQPVILAITGRDEPEALGEILAAGADDFIRKPVPPAHFAVRMQIAERRLQDRAARLQATAELEFRLWELRQLFGNLQDVFFSMDVTAGKLTQLSPSVAEVFGHKADDLIADAALWKRYLLPSEGGVDTWAELAKAPPGSRVVREYSIRRADGTEAWMHARVSLETDPRTGYLRADGVVADITKEWQASETLALRNRELAALYRVSELGLTSDLPEAAYSAIVEEVARVMEAPVVMLEELDRSADRLVVVAAHGIGLPDDGLEVPLHQTPAGVAVETGRPLVDRDPRSRRDLSHDALRALEPRLWASFPLAVRGVVTGTLTLVDTVPRNVDERWTQLGVSLASVIATFMERVEAEDALRESEGRHRALAAQLKQANQELESFAYSVSHDLRAPLRTMQGFAHALLQNYGDTLEPEAQDYARRIIASGRQSERLIADLLAYSRLTFEKIEVKPVELDVVVAQAVEQVQADITESKAHLSIARGLPVVLGSQTALVQVIANLLANAVKFVPPERRPEVRVRAEEHDDVARLWVEDNGIGIPEGQEERIFRVFERLSQSDDRPGTGIGLAIARRGMERIGGRCGVERLADQGSAFWIEAPKERRKAKRSWLRRRAT